MPKRKRYTYKEPYFIIDTDKHPERFPNPRIIEITDSFRKFVERRHSVVIAGNIDYNIWEW